MKQLTSAPGVARMTDGFVLPSGRAESRRLLFNLLRPEATGLPLDLHLWEIVAELDASMVDWGEEAR